jgi:hypothetical protein
VLPHPVGRPEFPTPCLTHPPDPEQPGTSYSDKRWRSGDSAGGTGKRRRAAIIRTAIEGHFQCRPILRKHVRMAPTASSLGRASRSPCLWIGRLPVFSSLAPRRFSQDSGRTHPATSQRLP